MISSIVILDMCVCVIQPCQLSNARQILEVRLHVLDHGGKKDLEYGNHSKIKKIFNPPNIVEVLQTEFASHRGKVMVSRMRRSITSLNYQLTS